MPNFLFSEVYLSLPFNFKIGPSLGLSCLISSMFIIILIICIIKITCFDNTLLIAELEEKLPKLGGLFLPITSPILVTFTRFLACTLKRFGLLLKKILPQLLIYEPSPNGQIISLIGAQAHF